MKKTKWLAVAVLLFCSASVARGQCTGYKITSTAINFLSPTDAAKQGQMTASIAVVVDGGRKNGKVVVTPGTVITYPYLTHTPTGDTSYGTSWYTIDNDPTKYPWAANSLGGTVGPATTSQAEVGHTYHMFFEGVDITTGSFSIDEVDRQVVAGPNDTTISADAVPTNAYYQLVSTFGGGSMMNNCGECQGGETQPCLQATHTPLFDASFSNPRTGEVQTISNASAGNVAKATESVSGTASIMGSVRPGDTPTATTTNKIYCTMFGWVLAQQWIPGAPDFEFAITMGEVIPNSCALTLRFFEGADSWGIQCNVAWKKPPATADRCSAASQVPDFNPGAVWDDWHCKVPTNCNAADLPPPNGTSTTFPKFYYEASMGWRIGGPPPPGSPDPIINGGAHNWNFPVYVAKGYIPGGPDEDWWILDLLNIAVAKGTGLPIDCTYRDHGTSPITSPW